MTWNNRFQLLHSKIFLLQASQMFLHDTGNAIPAKVYFLHLFSYTLLNPFFILFWLLLDWFFYQNNRYLCPRLLESVGGVTPTFDGNEVKHVIWNNSLLDFSHPRFTSKNFTFDHRYHRYCQFKKCFILFS